MPTLPSPAPLDFYKEAITQELPGVANNLADATSSDRGMGDLITQYLGAVMSVAALLLLLYLIWGAIDWISSGGDKSKVEKGREKITQAVIGIIVMASTLALFLTIQAFLGINLFQLNASKTSSSTT